MSWLKAIDSLINKDADYEIYENSFTGSRKLSRRPKIIIIFGSTTNGDGRTIYYDTVNNIRFNSWGGSGWFSSDTNEHLTISSDNLITVTDYSEHYFRTFSREIYIY